MTRCHSVLGGRGYPSPCRTQRSLSSHCPAWSSTHPTTPPTRYPIGSLRLSLLSHNTPTNNNQLPFIVRKPSTGVFTFECFMHALDARNWPLHPYPAYSLTLLSLNPTKAETHDHLCRRTGIHFLASRNPLARYRVRLVLSPLFLLYCRERKGFRLLFDFLLAFISDCFICFLPYAYRVRYGRDDYHAPRCTITDRTGEITWSCMICSGATVRNHWEIP